MPVADELASQVAAFGKSYGKDDPKFSDDELGTVDRVAAYAAAFDPFRYVEDGKPNQDAYRASRAIVKMGREYPELLNLASDSFGSAALANDLQWLVRPFDSLAGTDLTGAMIRAASNMVDDATDYTRSAASQYGRFVNGEIEAEAKWWLDATTVIPEATAEERGIIAASGLVEEDLLARLTDQPIQAYQAGDRLTLAAPLEDGTPNLVDIRLEDGFKIERPIDVLIAVAEAVTGVRHTLLSDPSEIRGNRTAAGTAAMWLGKGVDAPGRLWDNTNAWFNSIVASAKASIEDATPTFVRADSSTDIQDQRRQAEAEALAQREIDLRNDPERLLLTVAQELREQNRGMSVGGSVDAAAQWLAAPEVREIIDSIEPTEQETRELVKEFKDMLDEENKSGLRSVLGTGLSLIAEYGMMYGDMLDWGLAQVADFGMDVLGGTAVPALEAVGVEVNYSGPRGFAAFKDAVTELAETDSFAGELGLSGQAAAWVDIGANILLDPLNFIIPGQGRQARALLEMVAERPDDFLKLRSTVMMADEVLTARTVLDDVGAVAQAGDDAVLEYITRGMALQDRIRLADLPGTATRDEVLQVFRDALPGGGRGGTWIPDWGGLSVTRNQVAQVAHLARKANGEGNLARRAREILAKSMGGFERERRVSLAAEDGLDDLADKVVQLYGLEAADAPRLKGWMDRIWQARRDLVEQGRDVTNGAAVSVMDVEKQIVALRDEFSEAVRPLLESADIATNPTRRVGMERVRKMVERTRLLEGRRAALQSELDMLDNVAAQTPEQVARRGRVAEQLAGLDDIGGRVESLLTRKRELKIQLKNKTAPEGAGAELTEINAELKALKAIPESRGVIAAAETQADLLTQYEEAVEKLNALNKQLERARAAAARAERGDIRETNRVLLAELEQEYGREVLGLKPYLNDAGDEVAHPFLEGEVLLDWEPVRGERVTLIRDGEYASRYAPFMEGDDVAAARDLAESGLAARSSYHYMAASPQQLVAARMAKGGGWFQEFLAAGVQNRKTMFGKAVRQAQNLWYTAVLTNLRVALRASLDEAVRHMWDGGVQMRRSFRPGFGQEAASVGAKVDTAALPDITQRAMNTEFDLGMRFTPSKADWTSSARGGRQANRIHREATFRWLNGQVMSDPAAKALASSARATAESRGISVLEVLTEVPVREWDTAAFASWWADDGRFIAGGRFKVRETDPPMLHMLDAMEVQANAFAVLAKMSKKPSEVIDSLFRRATRDASEGGSMLARQADEEAEFIIRNLGPVPSSHQLGGLSERVMETLYGKPGRTRYGLFHADYFDRAIGVYEDVARTNPNLLLTPERLMEFKGFGSVDEARLWMLRNQERVDQIARSNGLWTENLLNNAADRFARKHASSLMYTPGASSMMGKRAQALVPFGPAQYDWLSYWGHEMRKAATVGVGSHMYQLPNVLNFRAMAKGKNIGALPLNLRMATRMSEYAAMYSKLSELGDEAEDWFLPDDMLRELTFFPRLDTPTNFLVDLGPGLGPLPVWTLRLIGDRLEDIDQDDPWWQQRLKGIDNFINSALPTLDYDDADLLGAFLPSYNGSILDVLQNTANVLGMFANLSDGSGVVTSATGINIGGVIAAASRGDLIQQLESSPYGREAVWAAMVPRMAAWDNNGLVNPELIDMDEVFREASRRVATQEELDALKGNLPFGRYFGGMEDLETPMWEGFVSELETLVNDGYLGDATRDLLDELWSAHQAGTMSQQQRYEFHDTVRNVLFGLRDFGTDGDIAQAQLLVRHPELAIALVSRYEPIVDEVSGRPVFEGAIPEGDDGRRFIIDNIGRYYQERPLVDVEEEIRWRVASAQRTLLRDYYTNKTGRSSYDPGRAASMDAYEGKSVTIQEGEAAYLRRLGVDIQAGPMSVPNLFLELSRRSEALSSIHYPVSSNRIQGDIELRMLNDPDGNELLGWLDRQEDLAYEAGYAEPSKWPVDKLAVVHEEFGRMIDRGVISAAEYEAVYARKWGPLDWSPTIPGPLDSLDPDEVTKVLDLSPEGTVIIDGDTLDVDTADGKVRFRLIGINAPDDPMPGADLAFDDLYRLMYQEGNTVQLVVWRPDYFGTTAGTDFDTGEPRLKAWLFVNGQPVYHSDVFTFRNPTGRGTGTTYKPLPRPTSDTRGSV